jgi:hypothetical protein
MAMSSLSHSYQPLSQRDSLSSEPLQSNPLDRILQSVLRIQTISLEISNEIEVQNLELEDLESTSNSIKQDSEQILRETNRREELAQREAICWGRIVVFLLLSIVVVVVIKIWRNNKS